MGNTLKDFEDTLRAAEIEDAEIARRAEAQREEMGRRLAAAGGSIHARDRETWLERAWRSQNVYPYEVDYFRALGEPGERADDRRQTGAQRRAAVAALGVKLEAMPVRERVQPWVRSYLLTLAVGFAAGALLVWVL